MSEMGYDTNICNKGSDARRFEPDSGSLQKSKGLRDTLRADQTMCSFSFCRYRKNTR